MCVQNNPLAVVKSAHLGVNPHALKHVTQHLRR